MNIEKNSLSLLTALSPFMRLSNNSWVAHEEFEQMKNIFPAMLLNYMECFPGSNNQCLDASTKGAPVLIGGGVGLVCIAVMGKANRAPPALAEERTATVFPLYVYSSHTAELRVTELLA